jgi:hypothetical protein
MKPVMLPAGFGETRGSEHEVWFSTDGRVIKATHPGEFGRAFGPRKFASLEEYLERVRLTVEVFGLDWQVHGTHGEGRQQRVITSQPLYVGRPASLAEIARFMQERRFVHHRTRFGDVWYREEDQILVADAEPKNIVRGKDGLAPIDIIVTRPSIELLIQAEIRKSQPD